MLAKYKITPQALNFAAAFFTHPMLKTSFLCYYYFKFQRNGSTFARCPSLKKLSEGKGDLEDIPGNQVTISGSEPD